MIDIDKAFENRWRMKCYILENIDGKAAKEIARDFFEAGIALAEPQGGHTMVTVEEAASTSFEQWWDLYDKKVDRKKCIKKWEKLTYNEKQLCIAATPAYVSSTPEPAYRKNPLTYLNGECWNDEIIPKNNGKSPSENADRLADILVG